MNISQRALVLLNDPTCGRRYFEARADVSLSPQHTSEGAQLCESAGLGFAIPYVDNGQSHDYVPDILVRLESEQEHHLILETKGHDPLAEIKQAAALHWVAAVNADGRHGQWDYKMVRKPQEVLAVSGV